jgi:hypothetical protein
MFFRPLSFVAIGMAALMWSGLSAAQQYRADEFLNLDLSKAVLSPKSLGPAAGFTPGPLDVTVGSNAAQAKAELLVDPKVVNAPTVHAESTPTSRTVLKTATSGLRVAHSRAERAVPHAPRTLVVLHGRNPVDAQARDTGIQVWPCRSGGICNWKR